MKSSLLNRRDFLKRSAAGVILASAPAVGMRAQDAATAAPAREAGKQKSKWAFPPAEKNAIFRSDLSRCTPASHLSRSFEEGRWHMADYETAEGVKGTMVWALPERDCGELTLPLEASGICRIHLGINYTKVRYEIGAVQVKLDHEPSFRRVTMEDGVNNESGDLKVGVSNYNHKSIQETYWKTADVTGRSLVFSQVGAPYRGPEHDPIANLSYVKLVPLTAEEERKWRATQPTAATGHVANLYCTGHLTGSTTGTATFHPVDEQWCRNEFTPYLHSDVSLVTFEAMRGNFCLFKTKLGYVGTDDNRWRDEWIDPLAVFTKLAHENGIKLFAAQRMIGAQYPMNRTPIAHADNYRVHPDWVKRDRKGVPLSNLSLAYPGVRAHWLGLLREALERGVDGLQLHFNRSTPFVYYEEPVVQSFITKHGTDPRQLPESDPRWQAHCAGYVTDYLREVRALLDEKPGRELGVTIYGEPHKYDDDRSPFDPIRYGCDVDTWIRAGLVNYVMPNPRIAPELLQRWRRIGGDRVHLWPDLMPRSQMPAAYARLAKSYYEAGADGVCLWDGEGRTSRISEWAAVQRLGHRDQLEELAHEAPSFYRRVPLSYLGGISIRDAYHDG